MTRGSWFPAPAPDTSVRPDAWRDHAACVDEDPELFFPIGKTERGGHIQDVAKAKNICARCPVTSPCLEYALDTGQEGIWGYTTETERAAIKRRRAAFNKAQQQRGQR